MFINDMLFIIIKTKSLVSPTYTEGFLTDKFFSESKVESMLFETEKLYLNYIYNTGRKGTEVLDGVRYLILESEDVENPEKRCIYKIALNFKEIVKRNLPYVYYQEELINTAIKDVDMYNYVVENFDKDYYNEHTITQMEAPETSLEVLFRASDDADGTLQEEVNDILKTPINSIREGSHKTQAEKLENLNMDILKKDQPSLKLVADSSQIAYESRNQFVFMMAIEGLLEKLKNKSTESDLAQRLYIEEVYEVFAEMPFSFKEFKTIFKSFTEANPQVLSNSGFITHNGILIDYMQDFGFYFGIPEIQDVTDSKNFYIRLFTESDVNKYKLKYKFSFGNQKTLSINIQTILNAL